jgi:hypothetical protein
MCYWSFTYKSRPKLSLRWRKQDNNKLNILLFAVCSKYDSEIVYWCQKCQTLNRASSHFKKKLFGTPTHPSLKIRLKKCFSISLFGYKICAIVYKALKSQINIEDFTKVVNVIRNSCENWKSSKISVISTPRSLMISRKIDEMIIYWYMFIFFSVRVMMIFLW